MQIPFTIWIISKVPNTWMADTGCYTELGSQRRAVAPTPAGPFFLLDIDLRMRKLRCSLSWMSDERNLD